MTKKRRIIMWALLVAGIAAIAAAAAGPIMSRVEQPKYTVTRSDGAIEVRHYGAMIAAEVEVSGERRSAINEGFQLIAAYIFGANKPNAKIAMTAPVTQQSRDNSWTVRFIMPESWTMKTLPIPTDDRVKLVSLPSKQMVAIHFSRVATDAAIAAKTSELRQYAADNNLSVRGEPVLAFYNPPWTLPFFRRNEIMLELMSPRVGEGPSG